MTNKHSADKHSPDPQEAGNGKVENDHNRTGNQEPTQTNQEPTQTNQGQRTPDSRSDRTNHIGSDNQSQSRQGGAGSSHHGSKP